MAQCKSCHAEITWVTMESGKKIPLDIKAQSLVIHEGKGDTWRVVSGYQPHWATCPQARKWRKR